ncbi:threonine--tRNA ligase [Euzebya tangerina]|uniref:threonine--tRNA ligase n=1 Tax=Euzebya tangerina TaxID=591198 RepID=UPI0039C8864F
MVVAAHVDDAMVDLDTPVEDGQVVRPIPADSDDGRFIIRHSTAHVMAQAVTDLFPGTNFGIGPPVENGFYYDFDPAEPFTEEDLTKIEGRMVQIVREDQPFERLEVSTDEALEAFSGNPYKVEIITDGEAAADDPTAPAGESGITIYRNTKPEGAAGEGPGYWQDLCRGPHVPTTKWIPAFTLQRVAGAYWRGDEKNKMLQRIYGTAWESKKALKAFLAQQEEARKRDHRKLGRELDLISFPDELGAGLAVWHPDGAIVRQEIEDYIRDAVRRRGYQPAYTPHIGKSLLWETSGHLGFYADGMYPPMEMDASSSGEAGTGTDYYPKPMNCPFHVLIYRSRGRSYRELPLRLAELGTVYRYERSGVIHGLMRARGFTQDDSHIFCTGEQLVDEALACVEFALDVYRDFGFDGPSRVALSTRPAKAETVGTDEGWAHAESALREALDRSGLEYVVDEGEGAFYGPKIDMQVTDAIGRAWQLTTVQIDFNLPERFGLTYTASGGEAQQPYMVHRALLGSVDRFFGVLLEHYGGAFPTWLAPRQAVVIPISDSHLDYAATVADSLRGAGLRAEVDVGEDSMGNKIRKHQGNKVPYMLIVGDNEAEERTVSIRPRYGDQRKGVPLDEFADELAAEVASRTVGPQPE